MHPGQLPSRKKRLAELERETPSVLVVGGGVTGAGLALDLALRGVRVALVERDDWASATSSASSRLIHGGLRYLEQMELGLVRESCLERGLLLSNAAGLVWPERFVFPVQRGAAIGRWKLAAGLLLYTAVSVPRVLGLPRLLGREAVRRAIPGTSTEGLRGGGSYLDGATDDARLCLAAVLTAAQEGALVLSRTEATSIEGGTSGAEVVLRDRLTGEERTVRPRAVVLCGGPFTDGLRARAGLAGSNGRWVRPTRGTHIVVPRERLPTDGAVILSSCVDGRVLFLIPWRRATVIGTTDLDAEPEDEPAATRAEVRYLLDSANGLVPEAGLTEDDVLSTWAGLRPLLAGDESDPSARSREERIERDGSIYTIAGGKLTAFRAMAETLGARIAHDLGEGSAARSSPTRSRRLRGALDRPVARPAWSSLDASGVPRATNEPLVDVWAMRYAALADAVSEACERAQEGRRALSPDTLLGEVDWAVREEDCLTGEDFFFRRTDLGLEPRAVAEAAGPVVLERLAELLTWTPERLRTEREALQDCIARRHRWRAEEG
jgi:glycerol-3-phosphate dehydrogenase